MSSPPLRTSTLIATVFLAGAAFVAHAVEPWETLAPTPQLPPHTAGRPLEIEGARLWVSAAIGKMWDTLPAFTTDQLRSIKVPAVIADGEYDEAIKQSHDRYMADTIPGARLEILPHVSHFAMLQNPAEFDAAVLDFLRHP